MTAPPTAEWDRIRSLLLSADPTHQAQAVALLTALGDPWLYEQALQKLRLSRRAPGRYRALTPHLPEIQLTQLRTGRYFRTPLDLVDEGRALRLLADAPPSPRAAALRAAQALHLGPWRGPLDLSGLRGLPLLRWLGVTQARALSRAEALDDLPALSCLSLETCADLSGLAGLRLESLERLLAVNGAPPPLGEWGRLDRLVIATVDPVDLAQARGLTSLRILRIDAPVLRQAAALAPSETLEELSLIAWEEAPDWSFLGRLPALRSLGLSDRSGLPGAVVDLDLEELEFAANPAPGAVDLELLRGQARLRRLSLQGVEHIPAIQLDRPLPAAESLRLSRSRFHKKDARYWSFLEHLPGLRSVALEGWYGEDPGMWELLARLPLLEAIQLQECEPGLRPPRALAERVRVVVEPAE